MGFGARSEIFLKFKTLIIDPPWPYDKTSGHGALKGYSDGHYKPLSIDDLAALPIDSIMDPTEAYVFMWSTGPFLPAAVSLFPRWGFKYITSAVWVKTTGLGVGYWFRGDHEHILIGKRVKAPSFRTGRRSVFRFETPRGRHSRKPVFLHETIEKILPAPYLEIFARETRLGWTVCGNEAPGDGWDIRDRLWFMAAAKGLTPASAA